MWLPVEVEYHILPDIFPMNMKTWLHVFKIVCITPIISTRQFKMATFGPIVMNEIIYFLHFTEVALSLYCYIQCDKNTTLLGIYHNCKVT